MKIKRILLTMVAAMLLVAISVGGTLAWLQAETGVVTNTFTVGEGINIDLDEAKVYAPGSEPDGTKFGKVDETVTDRVKANTYKLVPGWTYDKDPIVHLKAVSGDCYLFVKVVNGIKDIEVAGDTSIAAQMTANGWNQLVITKEDGSTETVTDVFFYGIDDRTEGDVVSNKTEGAADANFPVFATFTIQNLSSIDATYTGDLVTIDAYAIQADGFADAAAAWTAGQHEFEN